MGQNLKDSLHTKPRHVARYSQQRVFKDATSLKSSRNFKCWRCWTRNSARFVLRLKKAPPRLLQGGEFRPKVGMARGAMPFPKPRGIQKNALISQRRRGPLSMTQSAITNSQRRDFSAATRHAKFYNFNDIVDAVPFFDSSRRAQGVKIKFSAATRHAE